MTERPSPRVRLVAPAPPPDAGPDARRELELLVALARRDGRISRGEEQLLLTYALGGLDLSEEQARAVLAAPDRSPAAETVRAGSVAAPARTLQVMLELALADGRLTLNEVAFIERVGQALGLPLEQVRAVLSAGRERHDEAQDQRDLDPPPPPPPRRVQGRLVSGLLSGGRESLARRGVAVVGRVRHVREVTKQVARRRQYVTVREGWDLRYTYLLGDERGLGLFRLRPDRTVIERGTAVWVLVDPDHPEQSVLDPRYW